MVKKKELTATQNRAICLIVSGYDNDYISEATGVHVNTLLRWKKDPEFSTKCKQAISATFDAALAELVSGSQEASKKLREIIADEDTPNRIKVTAINTLLTFASRAKDLHLEERLDNLESKLENDE